LTDAFLPEGGAPTEEAPVAAFSKRVVSDYGTSARVPRSEQLVRKMMHFDTGRAALRYLVVQGRRNVREIIERRVRRRSARERLAL
jgi:hypothetical protein